MSDFNTIDNGGAVYSDADLPQLQRPQTRAARLSAIEEILRHYIVTSQAQLRQRLADEGIEVTQATLSRDLDEIQAIKIRSSDGSMAYAVPDGGSDLTEQTQMILAKQNPEAFGAKSSADNVLLQHEQQLSRVLSGLIVSVAAANNLIVVHTPSGAAQYAASAIDRQPLEGVLGTIAGDDTVLIIAVDTAAAQHRMQWLLTIANSSH